MSLAFLEVLMDQPAANPVWVAMLCAARCFIPLLLLLGFSYLLKRLGLIREPNNSISKNSQSVRNPDSEGLFDDHDS